jgi:hypothetical protein
MKADKIKVLCDKYGLDSSDTFTHKHYTIITRSGIDKIQAKEKIFITYVPVKVTPEFCVVQACASKEESKIETFGSAKYGGKSWNKERNNGKGGWDEFGNTTTWYVMEVAEKRAMCRAVLKLTGFYELGVLGQDESEDFKKEETPPKDEPKQEPKPQPKIDVKTTKPVLTNDQFESAQRGTKAQINNVLERYAVTTIQEKGLQIALTTAK